MTQPSDKRAATTCPDCTADLDSTRTMRHDDTCPVGLDTDSTAAADRAWLDAHPFTTEYRRELTYSERATIPLVFGLPTGTALAGRVVVTRLGDGVRARMYEGVHFVVDHDSLDTKAAS